MPNLVVPTVHIEKESRSKATFYGSGLVSEAKTNNAIAYNETIKNGVLPTL